MTVSTTIVPATLTPVLATAVPTTAGTVARALATGGSSETTDEVRPTAAAVATKPAANRDAARVMILLPILSPSAAADTT